MRNYLFLLFALMLSSPIFAIDSTFVPVKRFEQPSIETQTNHAAQKGQNVFIIGGNPIHVLVDSGGGSGSDSFTFSQPSAYSQWTMTRPQGDSLKTKLDSALAEITLLHTELSKKVNANAINPQDSTFSKYFAYGDTIGWSNPNGQFMLTRVLIGDSSAYATQDSTVAEVIRNGTYVKIPMRNLRTGAVDVYMSGGNGTNDFFVPEKIYWLKTIRFRRVNTVTATGHTTLIEVRYNQ